MTDLQTRRPQGPFRATGRLAVAFLFLSLCWVFTNPGAAAPDEPDHLVKALGNATGQLGERGPDLGPDATALQERNASTTRVYKIPERLVPTGMTCFAFAPEATAACQPDQAPQGTGKVEYSSAVGDYPPFLYLPIGAAALATDTPYAAFLAGRLVVALVSVGLLWLGMAQLARWLGRGTVLAYPVLMTPVAVFLISSVSTSGIELTAAAAVAAVVATSAFRPEAVHAASTQWTFLVGASLLALSRQLGVLALAVFVVVLLVMVGRGHVVKLFKDRQLPFLASVTVVGVATIAALWWERTYDHPAHVVSPWDGDALASFLGSGSPTLNSAFGTFGWLDTTLPSAATGVWIAMWVVAITMACLIGTRRESWTILVLVVLTLGLALFVYASAFFPIGAGIQGRHFLPLVSLAVVLSVTAIARRPDLSPRFGPRLYLSVAVVVFVVQALALYTNGRRYAVGTAGPWWWVPDAQWVPVGGWTPWLALSIVASGWLATEVYRLREPRGQSAAGVTEPAAQDT